jgi:DtxR family Mn-dependent transcriptional regulator
VQDEDEIEQQACKFEHILSPEVTDKICTFLNHPKTCPHGSPTPSSQALPRLGRIESLHRPDKQEGEAGSPLLFNSAPIQS